MTTLAYISLDQLDSCTIALEVEGFGVFSGVARFENHCLSVAIADPAGPFTVILDERKWDGEVRKDAAGYRIRLLAMQAAAGRA